MEKRESRMHLPTIDDFFTVQSERDSVDLEKIINLSIKEIDEFPNHPFKVNVNEELQEMMESIKEKGVLVPAIVRKKADGRYEMISGHRRKKASELLKIDTIPCIVRNLTDDEATIIMVDSNLQREKILPSEKAFAYKLKMEALKHQGERTDLTLSPMATKSSKDTAEVVGKQYGDGRDTVYRYIRLTKLVPELLNLVDEDKIALRPAVEMSFLTEEEQYTLLDIMQYSDCTPSLSQAIHLKKLSQENNLTTEKMEELLEQSKPNQTPKLKVSMNRLSNVLPSTLKNDREREEYVIKAVEWYDRYQKHRKKTEQER